MKSLRLSLLDHYPGDECIRAVLPTGDWDYSAKAWMPEATVERFRSSILVFGLSFCFVHGTVLGTFIGEVFYGKHIQRNSQYRFFLMDMRVIPNLNGGQGNEGDDH